MNEMFTQNFWKGDALGRPILGTKKTVSSFDQATLFDFYRNQFVPRNIVFAAAGNLEHESFVAEVERAFRLAWSGSKPCSSPARASYLEPAYHSEAQEISRTGAALPRRTRSGCQPS